MNENIENSILQQLNLIVTSQNTRDKLMMAQFEALNRELKSIKEHNEIFEKHTNDNFTILDKRMEKLEKKVDSLDKRVEKLEEKVDSLDKRVEKLEEKVDSLDKRMEKLEEKVDGLDKRVEKLEEKVDSLDKRVERLEKKVDYLDAKIDSTKNEIIAFVKECFDAMMNMMNNLYQNHEERIVKLENNVYGVISVREEKAKFDSSAKSE